MTEKLKFIVPSKWDGMGIKKYLMEVGNMSSRYLKKITREEKITLNYRKTTMDILLMKDDIIEIELEETNVQSFEPENLPLDIVYEDDALLVVNKPPFMLVHPTPNHPSGTLANGLRFYYQQNNEKTDVIRLVSRLDRDTSGLVLVAKNAAVHTLLSKQMEKNLIVKSYLAITYGRFEVQEGTIDEPIGKLEDDPIRRGVVPTGQRSITHFNVRKSNENATLVALQLETGRTHQIRVHLAYLGHPIIKDFLYGLSCSEESRFISSYKTELKMNRQALHAEKLQFSHPLTGQALSFQAKIPEDFQQLLMDVGLAKN